MTHSPAYYQSLDHAKRFGALCIRKIQESIEETSLTLSKVHQEDAREAAIVAASAVGRMMQRL